MSQGLEQGNDGIARHDLSGPPPAPSPENRARHSFHRNVQTSSSSTSKSSVALGGITPPAPRAP